ncbi:MAG: type II toxin-antitoxin system RelE/ParE family toxin [Deltaproteobacteria bacterium]|nr:MAG: type II toxin-antitoxin system RelE/ParE family toxin [Deltaproteobacteria bacterium]
MIRSFEHKGLESYFYTGSKKGIQPKHADKLSLILDRLHASAVVGDMNYPGASFHPLSGGLAGHYAVKVSGNWRVVFKFENGDAYLVDYLDYR